MACCGGWVGSRIEDVTDSVQELGRSIDDAIIQPVVHTAEKVLADPKAMLAVASMFVPGVGPAIGGYLTSALGVTAASVGSAATLASINAAIGSTLINTIANGGDLGKAIQNTAASYLGAQAGSYMGDLAKTYSDNKDFINLATNVTGQAAAAAVNGKDVGDAIKGALLAEGTSFAVKQIPLYEKLNTTQQKNIMYAATQAAQGKDADQIIQSMAQGAAVSYGLSQIPGLSEMGNIPGTDISAEKFATKLIADQLSGKSISQSLISTVVAQANNELKQTVQKATDTQTVKQIFQSSFGEPLPDDLVNQFENSDKGVLASGMEYLRNMRGLRDDYEKATGSTASYEELVKIANSPDPAAAIASIDKLTTTGDEVQDFLKKIYGPDKTFTDEQIAQYEGDSESNVATAVMDNFTKFQESLNPAKVEVAGGDAATALDALNTKTKDTSGVAGGAGSGTYFDSLGRLHVLEEGENLEDEVAATEAAIAADAGKTTDTVVAPKFNLLDFVDAVNKGVGQEYITGHNLTSDVIENKLGFTQGQLDYYGLHGTDYVAPAVEAVTPAASPVLTATPEMQPASQDVVKTLEDAGLTDTPTKTVEELLASEPTPAVSPVGPAQVEQPLAVDEPAKRVETAQTVDQIVAAEPTPAVSPVEQQPKLDSNEFFNLLDNQGADAANAYLKERGINSKMLEEQIGASPEWMAGMGLRGSEYEAPEVVTPKEAVAETPAAQDVINQAVAEPEKAQTIEQILAAEPPTEVSPVETPETQETTPEVQALIDEAVNNQQASTVNDQIDVDTQTQDLLNILSGGTDNGTTIEEVSPQEVLPPEPVQPVQPVPVEIEPEPIIDPVEFEGPDVPTSPTEDNVQDFLDRHVLDQPEEVISEDTVSPTEDVVQDYIDRQILDEPQVNPEDTSPDEEDVLDFLDRHVLDEPEVTPEKTPSSTEEDVQDFIDRHVLDEPVDTGEEDTSPDEEDVLDFLDRHILDEPDAESDISPDEEDVQDFIDRHILDEPPEEVEDGESPTEQDVIDYVDDHPNDGEEEDEEEEEKEEEEEEGKIGTGKVTLPKTKTPGKTPTTKTPATTTPATTTAPIDKNKVKDLLAALMAGQQYLPGVGDVANIKSDESLFGAIPGTESPASSAQETQSDAVAELLAEMDGEYAGGGHVDDFSVEALLQILRS